MDEFWLSDPKVLFSSLRVLPTCDMSNAEKMNALTRLLLISTAAMYFLGYEQYYTVLFLGILIILIFKNKNNTENFISEKNALESGIRSFDPAYDSQPHVGPNQACWFNQDLDLTNATYEITPKIQFNHDDAAKRSYMNAKYELTPLTKEDGFTEIWRTESDMCGGYSMVPQPHTEFPVYDESSAGQCNYIVRSKIDHLPVSQGSTGLNATRAIAEQAYNDSMMDFRNSIMNDHIDRFRRERQHNCADMRLSSVAAGSGGTI